jgi:hypothetical protein
LVLSGFTLKLISFTLKLTKAIMGRAGYLALTHYSLWPDAKPDGTAGLLCLDNDIEVDRPWPGRSNRALVLGQMVDSVQDESPCLIANRIKARPCGSPASV